MASSRFWAAKVLNFRQMAKEIVFYCSFPPAICRHSVSHEAPCGGQKPWQRAIKHDGGGTEKPCPAQHTQHGHGIRKHIHCKRHRPAFSNRTPQRLLKTYHTANCQELPLPNLPFTKILGNARSGKQQSFPFQKLMLQKHSKPPPNSNPSPMPLPNLLLRRHPKPRQTASPPPCRSPTSCCGDPQYGTTQRTISL